MSDETETVSTAEFMQFAQTVGEYAKGTDDNFANVQSDMKAIRDVLVAYRAEIDELRAELAKLRKSLTSVGLVQLFESGRS